MRTPLLTAALLAALPLAGSPAAPASGAADRREEFSELRKGMAGLDSMLLELRALTQEEAASDDADALVPRRAALLAAITKDLRPLQGKHKEFVERNKLLLLAHAARLGAGRSSRGRVDAGAEMKAFMEGDDLERKLAAFEHRTEALLLDEEAAFAALAARSEVRKRHGLQLRVMAACGAAAAVLLLGFAAWRRRRTAA